MTLPYGIGALFGELAHQLELEHPWDSCNSKSMQFREGVAKLLKLRLASEEFAPKTWDDLMLGVQYAFASPDIPKDSAFKLSMLDEVGEFGEFVDTELRTQAKKNRHVRLFYNELKSKGTKLGVGSGRVYNGPKTRGGKFLVQAGTGLANVLDDLTKRFASEQSNSRVKPQNLAKVGLANYRF